MNPSLTIYIYVKWGLMGYTFYGHATSCVILMKITVSGGLGPPIPPEAIRVMWHTPLILFFVSGINHPIGIDC